MIQTRIPGQVTVLRDQLISLNFLLQFSILPSISQFPVFSWVEQDPQTGMTYQHHHFSPLDKQTHICPHILAMHNSSELWVNVWHEEKRWSKEMSCQHTSLLRGWLTSTAVAGSVTSAPASASAGNWVEGDRFVELPHGSLISFTLI